VRRQTRTGTNIVVNRFEEPSSACQLNDGAEQISESSLPDNFLWQALPGAFILWSKWEPNSNLTLLFGFPEIKPSLAKLHGCTAGCCSFPAISKNPNCREYGQGRFSSAWEIDSGLPAMRPGLINPPARQHAHSFSASRRRPLSDSCLRPLHGECRRFFE
jgi:hypothetical protein